MTTALHPMTADERRRFVPAYLAYLRNRDGTPDLAARRFDIRERFFTEIDASPRRWVGALPVDQSVFDRNHAARQPEPGLDRFTLWALATARTNRAERFGVELAIAHDRQTLAQQLEDPHTWIQLEEVYHTRILRDILGTIGLSVEVADPNPRIQWLVRAMVHLPAAVSDVLVFCGEIVGVTIFSLLLGEARSLLVARPDALARVEALFSQILVDEVGHVHFLRSRLAPAQIAVARRLVRFVAANLVDEIPELGLLFGREEVIRQAALADVDAAAAAYPDRLVFHVA